MDYHRASCDLLWCWIHNQKVVGLTPISASCFMWDNIRMQDVNLDCASLYPVVKWVPNSKGYWFMYLA